LEYSKDYKKNRRNNNIIDEIMIGKKLSGGIEWNAMVSWVYKYLASPFTMQYLFRPF
jgi:hypothetical protein